MGTAIAPQGLAQALHQGALVAVPGPSGWLALARAGERERLAALPGIDAARLGLTAGSVDQLRDFLPPCGLRAQRLMARLLPGPVAITVAAAAPPVRLPAHPAWQALGESRDPLVAVPLQDAGEHLWALDEVQRRWPGLAPLSLHTDAQAPRVPEARLAAEAGRALAIADAGAGGDAALRDAARLHLLCVCSGNTCRSPMLMTLLRASLAARGIDQVLVESAGTFAGEGQPASEGAVVAMQARGLSLVRHRSRAADDLDLGFYDRIYCMTASHAAFLRQYGVNDEQLALVSDLAGGIPDPYGGPQAVYDECAEVLAGVAERIVDGV